MSKPIQPIPLSQINGLNLDTAIKAAGDLLVSTNNNLSEGGGFESRRALRQIMQKEDIEAGWGITTTHEFKKEDKTKYILTDTRYLDGTVKGQVLGGTNVPEDDAINVASFSQIIGDLSVDNSYRPCYETVGNKAFRVDGLNQNLLFRNISAAHEVGIAAPTTNSVVGTTGGSITLLASCRVYYRFKISDGDRIVRSFPSPYADITLTGAENAITVTYEATSHTDVNKIEIYRSLNSDFTKFYLAEEINYTGAGGHTITLPDSTVINNIELYFDTIQPYKAQYIKKGGSRLFYFVHPTEESSGGNSWLSWSKLGEFEHYAGRYESFNAADGEKGTGLGGPINNSMLVFKQNQTWKFDVTTLRKFDLWSDVGCIDGGSIQETGEGEVIWLSEAGVMRYDGNSRKNITEGKIQQSIIDVFIDSDNTFINSEYDPKTRRYHLLLTTRDANNLITANRHLVYFLDGSTGKDWIEHVNKDIDGNTIYETALGFATDAGNVKRMLVFSFTSVDETTVDMSQYDYDYDPPTEDTTTVFDTPTNDPKQAVVDSDGNYYVGANGKLYKINTFGATTTLNSSYNILRMVIDTANSKIYAICSVSDPSYHWDGATSYLSSFVLKLVSFSYTGTATELETISERRGTDWLARGEGNDEDYYRHFAFYVPGLALDSSGNVYWNEKNCHLNDWTANTAYSVDDVVVPTNTQFFRNGRKYVCITEGTSFNKEPLWFDATSIDQGLDAEVDMMFKDGAHDNDNSSIITDLLVLSGDAGHGMSNGDSVMFGMSVYGNGSTTPFSPLVEGTEYFIRESATPGSMQLHPTYADAIADTNQINFTGSKTGRHVITNYEATHLKWKIQRITDADYTPVIKKRTPAGSVTTVKTFSAGDIINGESLVSCEDTLYFVYYDLSSTTYSVSSLTTAGVLANITTYSPSAASFKHDRVAVASATEVYFVDTNTGTLYKLAYDTSWTKTEFNTTLTDRKTPLTTDHFNLEVYRPQLYYGSISNTLMTNLGVANLSVILLVTTENFTAGYLIAYAANLTSEGCTGITQGLEINEWVVVGDDSGIGDGGGVLYINKCQFFGEYWRYISEYPANFRGLEFEVEFPIDITDEQVKQIRKIVFATEAEGPFAGTIDVIPDDSFADSFHDDAESSEPSGSIYRNTYLCPGPRAWKTDDDFTLLGRRLLQKKIVFGKGYGWKIHITGRGAMFRSPLVTKFFNFKLLIQILGEY